MNIIAHRGRVGIAPENCIHNLFSLPQRVMGVEVDVRITSDGVPILIHDKTVDRTTNGSGEVSSLSLREIKSLSIGANKTVPTLQAYLESCLLNGVRLILLDIKISDEKDLKAIANIAKESSIAEKIIFMVREEESAEILRKSSKNARIGFFGVNKGNVTILLEASKSYGIELLLSVHGDVAFRANRETIALIKQAGFKAGASAIKEDESYIVAIKDGCYLILTDRSDLFENVKVP